MQTLDKCLSESQAPASFVAGIAHLLNCSLYATRLLLKDKDLFDDLLQNHGQIYAVAQMQQFVASVDINDEATLKKTLRQLRQRVLLRLIYRDLNGLADLYEVMQTNTNLAEIAIQKTLKYQQEWLQVRLGMPCDLNGHPQQMIVIGMGKLGGGELNVSSDIDLIFAYEAQGETTGEKPCSNQDFFNQLGKKIVTTLDDVTEDGFVFRVDMRLRPFGSEGVLVPNLDALAEYYQNNGREWERYAWIKGRVIVGNHQQLSKLLTPFIYRKYLDFGALASMRDLKIQIQRDVVQKRMDDNIKLGRGGIREIEFIAQVFQLIRGGRDTSLQIMPTLSVLTLLKTKGLLAEKTTFELTEAYVFLRNLEHRLMYVEDAQTHELPKSDEARSRIATAMNHADWLSFLTQLNDHRKKVQDHFDATFNDEHKKNSQPNDSREIDIWQGTRNDTEALQALTDAGFSDAQQTLQHLKMLRASSRYLQLPSLSRQRFDQLMPLVIQQSAIAKNADVTLLRTINLVESICRRASYLALLAEYPQALHLVIQLCAASPWLAQYLAAHPILLDELLDTQNLYAVPDFFAMKKDLSLRMQQLSGDVEAQMDAIRHFKHAAIMRFAAQDIAGKLTLEVLSDDLSALADLILQVSVQTIWQDFKHKHRENPQFSIIGYGKLGSKELGYASDLDIIFLYDDTHENAAEIYARFAQRINNWFNSLTSAGLLYETDLQLRPDGNSGLLVSSVEAFREYQLHKAWIWEHQALTRARFVAGDATIGQSFEQIRIAVLTQARDAQQLKTEVTTMREKMRASQTFVTGMFDIKHSTGGIIDVEFLVQYLVLVYANKHQQLTENIGNIGLLLLLSKLKILNQDLAESVALAYREYRRMQHTLKLQGEPHMRVNPSTVSAHVGAVTTLWQQTFA